MGSALPLLLALVVALAALVVLRWIASGARRDCTPPRPRASAAAWDHVATRRRCE